MFVPKKVDSMYCQLHSLKLACSPPEKLVAGRLYPAFLVGKVSDKASGRIGDTVDVSEIPNNHLRCIKPYIEIINVIDYQPKLVQAGFLNH